jgi:hypothetical protein
MAALFAAPAWGDDTGGSPTVVDQQPGSGGSGAVTPPPNPVDTGAPTETGGIAPTTPDTPPANTDPTPPSDAGQVPGGGDQSSTPTSPGGDSSGGGGGDQAQRRSPAPHDSSADSPSSSSTPASSSPSSTAGGTSSTTPPTDPTGGSGYEGDWAGQDNFFVDPTVSHGSGGAPTGAVGVRFFRLFAFAAARATREEAKERRRHETAQVSPLGGATPGGGGRLPGNNPYFNLLSGPGGAAGSLALLSLLAVLGAAIALPRHRSSVFGTPTVTWRPLAYVPPIELPG